MIKFESKEQVINALNSAELWLGVFQDKKDWFYTRMECFDNPYHIMVQLDYYCERWFKPMLYNIRLCQAIKWYLNNSIGASLVIGKEMLRAGKFGSGNNLLDHYLK